LVRWNLLQLYILFNVCYFFNRSGVKTECTCGFASNNHTPIKNTINPIPDIPKKPTKSNRKRRICETIDEDTFPASYPDDDKFPFNEEIQNDDNYSFKRSGTIQDRPEKNSTVRMVISNSSESSKKEMAEKKPNTFNILDIFDEGMTFDLLCNETLNENCDSRNYYTC
jgi:hypothetical protein